MADPPIELSVEAIGAQGDGVASWQGEPVYLPFTVPGDRVVATVGGGRGTIVRLIAPGRHRVEPVCAHFGDCGGCALQHLDAAAYRAWIGEQVAVALARRGLDAAVVGNPVSVASATRRRAHFKALNIGSAVVLGYNRRQTHRLVDITQCPVLVPSIVALLPPLRAVLAEILRPRERAGIMVTGTDSGLDVLVSVDRPVAASDIAALTAFAVDTDLARLCWNDGGAIETILTARPPRAVFGGVAVELPPGAFLQPTREGEDWLAGFVASAAGPAARVADLYAGCGTLSFPLAQEAAVSAFEEQDRAVAAIATAAARAGLTGRLHATARDLDRHPLSADELTAYDAVVFDPPRAGARAQAAEIAKSPVPVVIAVSCNPATFARDARMLVDGGYRLTQVTPVGQFLWSAHIELAAVFERSRDGGDGMS
jgi:23S rRNA (uracil1939-C5)-methyltransferase